jgi:hypothetical protein
MRTSHFDIHALLAAHGVIALREHPDLIGSIRWLVRRGDLQAVLPGVYASREAADTFDTRVRAVMAWDSNATLTAETAARVSFWPSIRVPVVRCALKHHREPRRGFQFSRRQVPAELVVSRTGLRYTSPALTALDLCEALGGDAIDEALRTRATTLEHLHGAFCSIPRTSRGRRQSGSSTDCYGPPESPPGRQTGPSLSVDRCSSLMSRSAGSSWLSRSMVGSTTASRRLSKMIVGDRMCLSWTGGAYCASPRP